MNSAPSKIEIRSVIKFLTAEKCTPIEIHRRLCTVYGENNVCSLRTVERWNKLFIEGRTSIDDDERTGRPSDGIEETVRCVRALLQEDRRLTITDLQQQMAAQYSHTASHGTIHTALKQHLEMTKVCARWVPRQLSDEHRKRRMGWALEFLTAYHNQGNDLIARIVTGDESWIHFWTPETKQQSKVWKKKGEEAPKKFKITPSAGKVMLTVFWDHLGPVYTEFHDDQKSTRITQETYFDTLNHLRIAVKKKRPGLLSWKPALLHDNARPHTAKLVQNLLKDFKWDVFNHSPYSPDLAPSDYHLFPHLKKELGGQRFATRDELISEVTRILQNLDPAFYRSGIEKLVYRLNKCLDNGGSYVEK